MKFIETVFSIKNKECHKIMTVLGLKFKFKNKFAALRIEQANNIKELENLISEIDKANTQKIQNLLNKSNNNSSEIKEIIADSIIDFKNKSESDTKEVKGLISKTTETNTQKIQNLLNKNISDTSEIKGIITDSIVEFKNNNKNNAEEIKNLILSNSNSLKENFANSLNNIQQQNEKIEENFANSLNNIQQQNEKIEGNLANSLNNIKQQNEKIEATYTKSIEELNLAQSTDLNELKESINTSILNSDKTNTENTSEIKKAVENTSLDLKEISDNNMLQLKRIIIDNIKRERHTNFNYNSDTERKILESFYVYYDNNLNYETYNNLIRNLPKEDIDYVDSVISRANKLRNTYGRFVDIFSVKEKEEKQKVKDELLNKIVKISDDIYKWQDYYLPIDWFEPCVFYYKHCIDYLKDIDKIRNKSIIDAGGFIGDSALVLSKYTNNKIYSFEPNSKNREVFKKTIELNNLTNVILEPYALGDEKKDVTFNLNSSASSIREFKHSAILEKETVPMITLDEYVRDNNINVGLIKTDLEGAEQLFLKGAQETIKTQKPTLLISIYHTPEDFFGIKPLIENWDLGYKFRIIKGPDYYLSLETMLVAEIE